MTERLETRRVLVVDDDRVFRERLVRALRDRGLDALGAASLDDGVGQATATPLDYAVVDLRLGAGSGLHVVRRLHELDPCTRIVMLTGYGSIATALDAVRSGATSYLTKPADVDEILAALHHDGKPSTEPPEVAVPTLDRVEWEHIDRVLVRCGGNVTRAAVLLGLHRRSLQRKLAKRPSPR